MSWPIPKDLLLKAPEVTWNWDSAAGENEVRKCLETFRITECRVVLMATASEHSKIASADSTWKKEPWYGTNYRVERFDERFINEVHF